MYILLGSHSGGCDRPRRQDGDGAALSRGHGASSRRCHRGLHLRARSSICTEVSMERSRVVIRNNIGWALCVTLFLQGDPTGGLLSRRSREFIFQRQRSDCNRLISDYIRRGRKTGGGKVFVIQFFQPTYLSDKVRPGIGTILLGHVANHPAQSF